MCDLLDAAMRMLVVGPWPIHCFDLPYHPMQRRHVAVAAGLAAAAGTVVVVAASVAAV